MKASKFIIPGNEKMGRKNAGEVKDNYFFLLCFGAAKNKLLSFSFEGYTALSKHGSTNY